MSICCLVNPIQLSEFDNIYDKTFDSNCYTGAIAIVCPSRAGWLHVSIMVPPLSIDMGIIESSVAEMLDEHPSSWI